MAEERTHRLRLKLPNGAELEAEGGADFVAKERAEFLLLNSPRTLQEFDPGVPGAHLSGGAPAWANIIESKDSASLQLRAKMRAGNNEKDACLVLLAASKAVLGTAKPTAAQLARWLRASGYPIGRVDRVLQSAVSQGEILASGSRRARRYELSGPGLAKAYGLAYQLANFIKPAAN